VLPNQNSKSRASSNNGYRSTLAHEICHLLVDRGRALPATEVLGGQSPKLAEQRANAFAAEFLLPREQAALACQNHPNIVQAATSLEQRFGVSREVVCHQIYNASFGQHLSIVDKRQLDGWKNWA
jgi:Zn-dependent peptidase ImmA (M78 family)